MYFLEQKTAILRLNLLVSEKNGKNKNLIEHFLELMEELLHRTLSVYVYFINSICVLCYDV